jgi:PIN domain nuclease of toxin-antitoxin system
MRLLLDTHVLLWALSQPDKLTKATRKKIDEAEVFVSAASICEIGSKSALGKLNATAGEILAAVEPAGFKMHSITGAHAAKAADLPPFHMDPFDRLLAAQAAIEPMILITNDRMLEGYGSFVTFV